MQLVWRCFALAALPNAAPIQATKKREQQTEKKKNITYLLRHISYSYWKWNASTALRCGKKRALLPHRTAAWGNMANPQALFQKRKRPVPNPCWRETPKLFVFGRGSLRPGNPSQGQSRARRTQSHCQHINAIALADPRRTRRRSDLVSARLSIPTEIILFRPTTITEVQ